VAGLEVDILSIENFLVLATKRKGHFRVVPRENNKRNFWENIFELRQNGNLSSTTLKNFKFESKTFYESVDCMNFEFDEAIVLAGSAENIQIFTEIL
jgi:hypothetical protein